MYRHAQSTEKNSELGGVSEPRAAEFGTFHRRKRFDALVLWLQDAALGGCLAGCCWQWEPEGEGHSLRPALSCRFSPPSARLLT